MPMICAVCQTENRDAAKFCHGCARKLPGFAATGPSLLDAMRPRKPAGSPEPGARRARVALPAEARGFWIGLGLLLLAAALGFGGWFAYVTRKVPPLPPASDAAQAVVAPSAPPAPSPRLGDPQGPGPVPLASSLAAGEAEVTADPPAAAPGSAAPTAAPPLPHRQPPRVATATPRVAVDPRRGCEHLNFFSAARCEAAHCDQPAYTRHPRCDAVREDRRRDEARRNPTLGY
ncbi:hypothetical protein AB4Z46_07285 [Variovorax sp. M-6]|uniref:hypothetical protein n=1 Tax=Variovorax sp. M-6 TaxID=3233041 RepID=UPI003F9D6999